MENVIIGILLPIIIPIAYGIFYYLKEKEEKKITYGSEFTVKMSKGIWLFFLVFMLLCFLGMIAIVVMIFVLEEPNETRLFWLSEGICFAFFLLGTVGFLISKYNYIVVKNDEIIVKKIFKKPTILQYSDITYINCSPFGFGEVSCFDSDGIPLFAVDHYHVGVEQLDSTLRDKGYLPSPNPYPTEEMKNNANYIRYKKKSSLKVAFWCLLIFGILLIGLGSLIHSFSDFQEYENVEISGSVEAYTIGEETLKMKLENDNREYYINNIVYKALNENVYDVMKQGTSIVFHIAYVDEYERYNISQIEVNDIVYLDMIEAEKKEYSNYKGCKITSYVTLGIGGILIALCVVEFIKIKKLK